MNITFNFPDHLIEKIIKGIMENFPEASVGSGLVCVDYHYPDSKPLSEWRFKFWENETAKTYEFGEKELLAAFPLLFTDKWSKGLTQPLATVDEEEWDNWLCQADAADFDAFVQLACFGEIIYG